MEFVGGVGMTPGGITPGRTPGRQMFGRVAPPLTPQPPVTPSMRSYQAPFAAGYQAVCVLLIVSFHLSTPLFLSLLFLSLLFSHCIYIYIYIYICLLNNFPHFHHVLCIFISSLSVFFHFTTRRCSG